MDTPDFSSTTTIQKSQQNGWIKILLITLLFYILVLGALVLTQNPNLFPTLAMVGNFAVPVAYVAFFYERRHQNPARHTSTCRRSYLKEHTHNPFSPIETKKAVENFFSAWDTLLCGPTVG